MVENSLQRSTSTLIDARGTWNLPNNLSKNTFQVRSVLIGVFYNEKEQKRDPHSSPHRACVEFEINRPSMEVQRTASNHSWCKTYIVLYQDLFDEFVMVHVAVASRATLK